MYDLQKYVFLKRAAALPRQDVEPLEGKAPSQHTNRLNPACFVNDGQHAVNKNMEQHPKLEIPEF